MEKITNRASIWGFSQNYEKHPLLTPFASITEASLPPECVTDWNGNKVGKRVKTTRSIVKAATYYVASQIKDSGKDIDDRKLPNHLALGCKSTDGKEIYYCEFQDNDPLETHKNYHILSYNSHTNIISGAVYDPDLKEKSEYKIHKNAIINDGTAVFLTVLPYIMQKSAYVVQLMSKYQQYLIDIEKGEKKPDDIDVWEKVLVPLCYTIYKGITGEADFQCPIKMEVGSEFVESIRTSTEAAALLLTLEDGPSEGKNITGKFKYLGNSEIKNSVTLLKSYSVKVNFTKPYSDFSNEEIALIPPTEKSFVVSKEYNSLLSNFNRTFNNTDRSAQITQFLIKGGTGIGKSTMCRQFAHAAKRPYVVQQISANTTEDDLKGVLLPYTNDTSALTEEEKDVQEAMKKYDGDELINAVAKILHLPSSLDCMVEPAKAFEQITGVPSPTASFNEANSALIKKILGYTKNVVNNNDSDSAIKYKYIPSNLIRAFTNGWCVEIQEINAVNNPAVLHCLFDGLEKSSTGVINTINGDVYRHPDFILFATMNEGYSGTHELNNALLNRFDMVVDCGNLQAEQIEDFVKKTGRFKLKKDLSKFSQLYTKIMEFVKEEGIDSEISFRNLRYLVDAVADGEDVEEALELFIFPYICSKNADQECYDLLLNKIKDCSILKKS